MDDGNKYNCSLETRLKRQKSMLGKKVSDETKRKMRIAAINNIEKRKGQCVPNYNINGCVVLDSIMKENNTFIQHAENGGEFYIKELGYWLDGYDKENNIAYEFDEKSHFNFDGSIKEKDISRQSEIEKYLRCKFIRIKQ